MTSHKSKTFLAIGPMVLAQVLFLDIGFAKPAAPVSCLVAHGPEATAKQSSMLHPRHAKHWMMREMVRDRVLRNRFFKRTEDRGASEETASSAEKAAEKEWTTPPPVIRNSSTQPLAVFEDGRAITGLKWAGHAQILVNRGKQDLTGMTSQFDKINVVDRVTGQNNISYEVTHIPEANERLLIDVAGGTNHNSHYRFIDKITHQEIRPSVSGWNLNIFDDLMVYSINYAQPVLMLMDPQHTTYLDAAAHQNHPGKIEVLKKVPFLIESHNPYGTKVIGVWSTITKAFEQVVFSVGPQFITDRDFQFTIGHGHNRALVFSFSIYNSLHVFDHEEVYLVKISDLKAGQVNHYDQTNYERGHKLSDRYGLFKNKTKLLNTLIDFETGEEFQVYGTPHVLSDRTYALLQYGDSGAFARILKLGDTNDSFGIDIPLETRPKTNSQKTNTNVSFIEGTDFAQVLTFSDGQPTITELFNLITRKKVWEGEGVEKLSISPDGEHVAYVDSEKKLFVESLTDRP